MFKARYYKVDGTEGKPRALPEVLFDGVVNEPVLHRAVKVYRNNQRQGTGSAKNRSAARGGSRKPWRQKGTGRARQGTIRAPQWAGGGRAFPPIPHSWREKLPRKMKALARRSAFNARAEEDRVVLVDAPALDAPKTREVREFLEALELAERKVLFLTHGLNPTLHLSARNLPNVILRPFGEEAPYDILWADMVVIERGALESLQEGAGAGEGTSEEAESPTGSAGEEVPEETAAEAAQPEPEAASDEPEAAEADADAEDEEKTDA